VQYKQEIKSEPYFEQQFKTEPRDYGQPTESSSYRERSDRHSRSDREDRSGRVARTESTPYDDRIERREDRGNARDHVASTSDRSGRRDDRYVRTTEPAARYEPGPQQRGADRYAPCHSSVISESSSTPNKAPSSYGEYKKMKAEGRL